MHVTLTALDVSSIQRYIFGSNRLQENIGASELVYRTTHQWAFEELPKPNNVGDDESWELDTSRRIEDGELAAEVVYAGGGNTLILFSDEGEAKAFVNRLSRKLIEDAPGLDLVAAHISVDWKTQAMGGSETGRVKAVMDNLVRVKHSQVTSAPVLGLGVTAACQSTGLVAVAPHPEDDYPISAEVRAKLAHTGKANDRLINLLPRVEQDGFRIPFNFDHFGRSPEESSYIAVVHADGNGMGKQVRAIADEHDSPGMGNRAYIQAIREFSRRIECASQKALSATADTLLGAVSDRDQKVGGVVPIRDGWLPFRPLVFGGDDVTFVCDGRLGLTLAARYLGAFEEKTSRQSIAAFACAGIAVVKTHYPFARAYQLAEELCRSAKNHVRDKDEDDFSALDWHFAASGLLGGLNDIRRREYELGDNDRLYMRPVRLRSASSDWRTWENFSRITHAFNSDKEWAGKRNKVMKLRQVLRGGEASVKQFIAAYDDINCLPEMTKQPVGLDTSGWDGNVCAYFDPIEAMDFFVLLDGQQEER